MANPKPDQRTSHQSAAVVLSIAGSDSSGGAGIQADIKAGAASGAYVATAITAITAQSPSGVYGIYPVTPAQLSAQITAVCDALPVAAIKLGMLATVELLQTAMEVIPRLPSVPLVVDPVMGASSGGSLVTGEPLVEAYRERVLPHASLVTPNLLEAAQLLDCAIAGDHDEMVRQALALKDLGAGAVLLKGGHAQLPLATDYLVEEREPYPFSAPRQDTAHTHGSGCTLATAIAAGLAQGLSMKQAVATAKTYIQGAIMHSGRLNLVTDNGPVHHFYQFW